MSQSNICLFGALAVSASAQGAFVGGGVVSLQSWNDAANASGLADLAGGPVRVYRLFAAFDGQSPTQDSIIAVDHVQIDFTPSLVNVSAGFPSGDVFEDPALRWDSFVTINVDLLSSGGGEPGYFEGVPFVGNSVQGGWFYYEDLMQGLAGTNAGADDFGSGLFLTMLAQITVRVDAAPTGDLIDLRSDGYLGGAGVFSGVLLPHINNPGNVEIGPFEIIVPAPSASCALLCAGCMAVRRRRAGA